MGKKSWFKSAGCKTKDTCGGTGGCFYFLGFLGMLAYHINTAPTIWDMIIGFLQSLVWPAMIVYNLLVFMAAAA